MIQHKQSRTGLFHLLVERLQGLARFFGYMPPKSGPTAVAPRASRLPAVVSDNLPIIDKLRTMQREFEESTVRLGIIGETGAGKSSLINAIVGQPIAPVGNLI